MKTYFTPFNKHAEYNMWTVHLSVCHKWHSTGEKHVNNKAQVTPPSVPHRREIKTETLLLTLFGNGKKCIGQLNLKMVLCVGLVLGKAFLFKYFFGVNNVSTFFIGNRFSAPNLLRSFCKTTFTLFNKKKEEVSHKNAW